MRSKLSLRYGRVERRYFKWVYLFLLPTLAVFLMFYAEPMITLIRTSFTKWDGFNDPQRDLSRGIRADLPVPAE